MVLVSHLQLCDYFKMRPKPRLSPAVHHYFFDLLPAPVEILSKKKKSKIWQMSEGKDEFH